ncbi:MAG: family 43 glycosylhydrolase [Bdellovibrionales bacterium]|nr:family 43 glycosylhydrolase [Bdellovibrionales bacterium]
MTALRNDNFTTRLVFFLLLILVANFAESSFSQNAENFRSGATYRNPLTTQFGCADPAVLNDHRATGHFYLACTGGRFKIRMSRNLVTWRDDGTNNIMNTTNGIASWSRRFPEREWSTRNWAPELAKIDGRYVAYYTQNTSGGFGGVGVSDSAHIQFNPFREIHNWPLLRNDREGGIIDPSYFKDQSTGKHYILYKVDGNSKRLETRIMIREMGPHGAGYNVGPSGRQSTARTIKRGGNSLATLVEGQELIKKNGYYYLFYSHGSFIDSYKVKVARSRNIYGPYTGDRVVLSERRGGRFYGPGHGKVVPVNGKDYYFYHAYDRVTEERTGTAKRYPMLDRIYWYKGWPIVNNGHPSEWMQYRPLSSEAWYHKVHITWNGASLPAPKYSLDVKVGATEYRGCVNANRPEVRDRDFMFHGDCLSRVRGREVKDLFLHRSVQVRVCAAAFGDFERRRVECTRYQSLRSESVRLRFSEPRRGRDDDDSRR